MVEFYGWATIRFTAEYRDRDDEEQLQNAAVTAVQSYVREMGYGPVSDPSVLAERVASPYSGALVSAAKANVVVDARVVNGEALLWTAGAKNHATPIQQELLDLFTSIAQIALGSYGLLYLHDDEDAKARQCVSGPLLGAWRADSSRRPVLISVRAHAGGSPSRLTLSLVSSVPLVEALGPPVKQGGRADAPCLAPERCAVRQLRLFELLNAVEMAIGKRGIGERPQVLRWLQFERIRRQEEQMRMVGHA
jgi:hypothetical protein